LFEHSKRVDGIVTSIEMGVLLGRRHPWATPTRTIQQQLETLTTADVQRFHERTYVPEVSALVVVGDASAEQVFALAERHFGSWQRGTAGVPTTAFAPRRQAREVHAVLAGGEQSQLYMVQPAVGTGDPDYHAFELISRIIAGGYDSRSNVALRHELGATYGVRADARGHRRGGHLRLWMSVENAQLYEAASKLRQELARLQDAQVSDAELESAKSAYLSSFELSSTSAVADLLAGLDMQGLSPDWLVGLETHVAAITADQLRALARAHFDPDRASIIAVGNLYRTLGDLEQLGKVTAYQVTSKQVAKRDRR
jgi:zinc protease